MSEEAIAVRVLEQTVITGVGPVKEGERRLVTRQQAEDMILYGKARLSQTQAEQPEQ